MIDRPFQPDELDALLRRSLQDRPEPSIGFDLAQVAIQKAASSSDERSIIMLTRFNRLSRAVTAIAAILIVAVAVWLLYSHVAAGGFQDWSTTSTTVSDTTTSTTTGSDSSTTASEWMLTGAALTFGALVVVLCQRAIGASDDWITATPELLRA